MGKLHAAAAKLIPGLETHVKHVRPKLSLGLCQYELLRSDDLLFQQDELSKLQSPLRGSY